MNTAQITSIVKALANFTAGILTTHGATKAASLVNGEDTTGIIILAVVWIYSHFFQHTDEKEATATPLPASKGGGVLPPAVGMLLIGISIAGLLQLGCAGQNNRLEIGGAYNPAAAVISTNADSTISTNLVATGQADFKLYAADAAFDFAYSTLGAAFKIERDNRAFLWKLSPSIKHTLDDIRPKASKAVAAYTTARTKYIAVPVAQNADELQMALETIQQLSDAAASATSELNLPAQ